MYYILSSNKSIFYTHKSGVISCLVMIYKVKQYLFVSKTVDFIKNLVIHNPRQK